MAYIIRSDAAMRNPENAVGNIHGFYGPSDYRAMLDFSHQMYLVDGESVAFGDVCSLARSGVARYLDVHGRIREAAENAPRFHAYTELQESGLLLEQATTNYCTGDANGSSFSAPNASAHLCVSWAGKGAVSPVATGLTLVAEVFESGRTSRFYSRSGAVSGTISVTGEVSEVMVTNSNFDTSYVPHGGTRSGETLKLVGVPLSILASGTGTILCRFALAPDNGASARNAYIGLSNSAAPHGGLEIDVSLRYTGLGTGEIVAHADGAASNVGVQIARNLGNRSNIAIVGGYFSGFGANAGIISYGQAGSDTAAAAGATPPTAIDEVYIGTLRTGMISNAPQLGAVLTHCIVYDRMVSNDEAFDLATFGT